MKTKSIFLRSKNPALVGIFCLILIISTASSASAAAIRSGFNANSLPANDDDSTGAVALGFSINVFGTNYDSVYINNNGNITFDASLRTFTPQPFGNLGRPIIAPFWADVDTRGSGSDIVRYGTGMVDGRNAFGVTWVNVGYYDLHFDKLNSFQLIIIDRSDRATGSFDAEFNYDSITWETGDSSGGTGGLGGNSARAGFSDGTVNDFELPGSAVNGGFLNSNSTTGLKNNSRNSTVLGRYVFEFPLQARVTKVEYEQINGGTSPIDNNPNTQGGRRIFPDKDTPTDGIDRRKIRVKAQYGLNSAGVRIYFRNFDLDDPSASSAPIDDESTPNAGDDNNGNVNGSKAGELSDCAGTDNGLCYGLTNSNGIATVDFTTTRQPGDNFTVAASANKTYLTELTLADNGIDLKDTNTIQTPVTTTTANACALSSIRACRAEMLTVWRRLHIEIDSMDAVVDNNIIGNINGTVTVPRSVGLTPGVATVNVITSISLDPNRFNPGRLVVGSHSLRVTGNTGNSIQLENSSTRAITLNNLSDFVLYDDDDFNDNNGFFYVGDAGDNVDEPSDTLIRTSDTACSSTVVSNCNMFAPAYVKPYRDLTGDSEMAFIQNINVSVDPTTQDPPASDISDNFDFANDLYEDDVDFWTVYLNGAYQYDERADMDPNTETPFYGYVDELNGKGALIFMEMTRPLEIINPSGRPVGDEYTVVHELGHLFFGQHSDVFPFGSTNPVDAGLMAITRVRTGRVFTPVTINKIRGGEFVFNGNTTRITHP